MNLKRIPLIVAGAVTSLALVASPAMAWDCIRIGGSEQGMNQSQKSGNWGTFTIADFVAGGVESGQITEAEGACALDAWRDAGLPESFSVGLGVGGANGALKSGRMTEDDFYVIAKSAPPKVLTNGKGIDHVEALVMSVASDCLSGELEH